jgi:hypothetical protein
MRQWIPAAVFAAVVTATTSSYALAPGDKERGFREGANHHVGDDGFVEAYGRAPGPWDGEELRMHAHFMHVRRWLADRPPTKPELAERREEILGYFDEYIARGTTPANLHVPWRTPVFIDDQGTICAVGHLIERTAGRALAEKIAHAHRYNLLEDIAAAMPEVQAWVEGSGLTLEELASIQPGYTAPTSWNAPDLFADAPIDFTPITIDTVDESGVARTRYPTGERLAEGRFAAKKPEGAWRFYYPSGNLAATGSFSSGLRNGRWTFFHDSKDAARMATGSFLGGTLVDEWKHFDETGALVARTQPMSPNTFGGAGLLLDLIPSGTEHVRHWVHQANIAGTRHRLDYLADGTEQLYVKDGEDSAFDPSGHELTHASGEWQSRDCHWTRIERASARSGDVVTLHGLELRESHTCGAPERVPIARAKHLDEMMALRSAGAPITARLTTIAARPTI